MKKTKTKCYLYTRVSTSMQVDGYSLDAQRDKLRKYAEYEDMIVAGEYSDEGFSGKNIQGRHEFQRMLQDIQDCKDGVEYVLVFKLSRFGRNAADVLNSLQLMQDFGVNLICVEDGIDSSKDSGKLMISVLSAVAEIERENIRTQTMAGREQKAREGKWNGGFAPYGYRLENGQLLIAEDEVDVIRTIFDRYIHTNDGVSGVAKYLNRQGFVKKLRQNGTIPGFSASFVKSIIDNPVYMGKIAYGRRRTEKKIGTRNEMHVVEQSEFPVYEGKHEAIISEEDWNLAQEKRKVNAYRREKVNDPTHAHILSGILKCPCCGKSLYGNIAKAHSKDKKTRYYYYCKNTVTPTGHECTFRLNIEQTEMNRMVAAIISAMVNDPRFADAIKEKIGSAVDTKDLEKQLETLQAQLRQTLGTKARLERQMDNLDVNDPYYDRKISDLQRRYDEQYGRIDEVEVQIDDVQSQIRSIRQEKISGDNIYRLLLAFDQVYEAASEVERKEFMRAFIERIELFPEKQPDGNWIRKIIFNFPVPVNGAEVKELPLENETMVERFSLHQFDPLAADGAACNLEKLFLRITFQCFDFLCVGQHDRKFLFVHSDPSSAFHAVRFLFLRLCCCDSLRHGSAYFLAGRLLQFPDLLPGQVDEPVQNRGMGCHRIVVSAIKVQIIFGFREVKGESPILIGRRKAAVPGFHLNCRRKHKADPFRAILLHHFIGAFPIQSETIKVTGNGFLNILLAVDIRPVGCLELFKLPKLAGMTAGFMINRCIDDWFHQVTLLFTFCADEVISDLLLICVCPFLKNIQLILCQLQLRYGFQKKRMPFFLWEFRRIQFPQYDQMVSVIRQLTKAMGQPVIHDLIRTDLMDSSDRTDRLMPVILNAKIICQLQCCFSGRQTEKAAGEINHITIRLASEAMEAFINFHARIPVIVERTFAHASASHLQVVAFSGLKSGHGVLHSFIKRHSHHRSCSGFFFSACAAGRSRFSLASSSARRALLVRSSSSCGKGLPSSALAVAIC